MAGPHEPGRKRETIADAYGSVASSFGRSLIGLWDARVAQFTLMLALTSFRSRTDPIGDGPHADVLKELESIERSQYDALRYVFNVSQLVHATALFDSLITDSTRFLYLAYPGSMGTNHALKVGDLLAAESKSQLISQAAERRAREDSYASFADRLGALGKRYGMALGLTAETERALAHYSGLRNAILHDQAAFAITLTDEGDIAVKRTTCPAHPRAISDEDAKGALRAYAQAGSALATSVFRDALTANPGVRTERLLSALAQPLASAPADVDDTRGQDL